MHVEGFVRSRAVYVWAVATSLCCALVVVAAGGTAYAAGPKLRLLSNGKVVPKGQRSAVINQTSFPGFKCEGFNGAMRFEGNGVSGVPVLRFMNPGGEGGGEAFQSCVTEKGETVSTATEGLPAKLATVAISAEHETVTEQIRPVAFFEDKATGCVWQLSKLSGALPKAGPLEGIHVAGTVRLAGKISAKTCPKLAEAMGTVTIEASPEGAPPGSYELERIP
jgi:hypothetical protein